MCNLECDTCLHSNRCTHFEQMSENYHNKCENYIDSSPDIENEEIWNELSYNKYTDNLFDYVEDSEDVEYSQDYKEDN